MSSTQPPHAGPTDECPGMSQGCSFGPLLSAYHDGELSGDQVQNLQSHLATCPVCAAEMADLGRFSRVFASATFPPLMLDRREAILDSVRAMPLVRPERNHLRYVRRISAVAAAIFVLALGQIVYQHAKAGNNADGGATPQNTSFHKPSVTQPATPAAPAQSPAEIR